MLNKKSNGTVDGFVVEAPTAGGHNAPPRGTLQLNERGEPVYGVRDQVDLQVFRDLGKPFWLAGSYGSPEGLCVALEHGAAGIQVGTAFAFCEESGLREDLKQQVLQLARSGSLDVRTDSTASPTGFPFKIVELAGSLSDEALRENRHRQCDLGYLRHAFCREDGTLGWRCPAEKPAAYVQKGGSCDDTLGRQCLCNALMANIGLGQVHQDGLVELPLVTAGDEARHLAHFFKSPAATNYSAEDVIAYLLTGVQA